MILSLARVKFTKQFKKQKEHFWNFLDENFNNSNECVAENGKSCIFPFNYHDKTFDKCTHYDANEGKVWCAVAVNSGGDMITWKDCDTEACKG